MQSVHIALVGNPNCGKTSLFNALTGLRQQVGNFPGVTVDKKIGFAQLNANTKIEFTDLPGTYSLYPRRADEWVAYKVLMKQDKDVVPEIILLVVDASNLKRNLLFCSQLIDLNYPVVIALTMMDLAQQKGIEIDIAGLEAELGVPIVIVNPRKNTGLEPLKKVLEKTIAHIEAHKSKHNFLEAKTLAPNAIEKLQHIIPEVSDYEAIHYLINHENFPLNDTLQEQIEQTEIDNHFNGTKVQAEEVLARYHHINLVMEKNVQTPNPNQQKLFTEKLDNVLLHPFWGYLILFGVLFILFQSIFWLAQFPMDAIDSFFAFLTGKVSTMLPDTWWSNLLVNGLLAGIGGVVVFVPQIMILFGLTTILEDTGYMARISFLSDKFMRKVGLNGKSIMPMISGFACAVPAIMSARNIENKKERLLTIMVTPLMSCSARLPVYTILTALVLPKNPLILGFVNARGMLMMAMYLLGIILAILASFVLQFFIKSKERSFFIMELPIYRGPRWKNVGITMIEKAKIFMKDAGRVIIVISLIIWFLSSYGPSKKMDALEHQHTVALAKTSTNDQDAKDEIDRQFSTEKLENSYAGILGHKIEPAIAPIGFDWKIGIALITSFAAREVFVGTMATIYSVDESDESTLQQKMANAKRPDGSLVYTIPTAVSLMVFYVLAMQCMSTLAIVKRETKSWKWPMIQLLYMTILAYGCSYIVYHLLQ